MQEWPASLPFPIALHYGTVTLPRHSSLTCFVLATGLLRDMVVAEASKGFRVSTFILVLCHPSTLTEQSPRNLRNVPTGLGSPSISNRDLTFGHVCSDDLSLSWCMDKPRVHLKYLHQSHQRDPDAQTDSLRTLTGHGGSGEHSVTTGA